MDQDTLKLFRVEIDQLDETLLTVLSERMKVVREIDKFKKQNNLPARDEERYQEMIARRVALADEAGLDRDFARKIFDLIHDYAVEIQTSR